MDDNFLYVLTIWQISIVFFVGIIVFTLLGYLAGVRSRKINQSEEIRLGNRRAGLVTLLSLMLGFTFGMAGQRYKDYKKSMIDEVNCISTAFSYSDLYPEPHRTEFRKYFLDYVHARIEFYDAGADIGKVNESRIKSKTAGINLWNLSSKLFKDPEFISPSRFMVQSVNEMLDAGATREESLRSKIPPSITVMIAFITFVIVYMAGFESTRLKKREILYTVMFAAIITLVYFVIIDLERPDSGFIKPAVEQEAMIELSKSFTDGK